MCVTCGRGSYSQLSPKWIKRVPELWHSQAGGQDFYRRAALPTRMPRDDEFRRRSDPNHGSIDLEPARRLVQRKSPRRPDKTSAPPRQLILNDRHPSRPMPDPSDPPPATLTPAVSARATDPERHRKPSRREESTAVSNAAEDGSKAGKPGSGRETAAGRITTHNIRIGQIIARRYEVVSVLGEGGMGIVYRCRDAHTGRHIALKRVILPDGKLAQEYVAWFYKEARALASLDHINVVHAKDFGQLRDGSPYLAMELVNGLSLHDYSNARLSFPIVWSVVDQILSALAHAHSRGVIHGDLKPSNIIVEEGKNGPPQVHILDFGLAWLKQDPHDTRLDGEAAMEFQAHAGAGTPGYMAPEQIMHEMHHVCGATDIYSLACILFKMLSGAAPFSGNAKELLKYHAYTVPPPLRPAVNVPEGVKNFVSRCLEKQPWHRFEFAAEARREWATYKPDATDQRVWRFPRVAGLSPSTQPSKTAVTAPQASNPNSFLPRALGKEKAQGLLGIRPSPLVGREEIRGHLLKVCDDVVQGRGAPHRLVLLVGPAGVGKSRIAEWLISAIHERGTMVPLLARYRRMRSSSDGMVGAVNQHFNYERTNRETIEKSLLARWTPRGPKPPTRRLRTWVAGAAEWLRPNPPGRTEPGPSGVHFALDTLEVRRQVIRRTLRTIAGERPLLFLLDDLHNAAQTTLDGLVRIHEQELDQPLVLIATVRSEDVQLGTSTAERLRRLRERFDGEVVEVNPMDRDTTFELLRASLPLDEAAVREAQRRSRGFPLFALQQLHAWAHAGEFEFRDGAFHIPQTVLSVRPKTTSDIWESRMASLPSNYQEAAYGLATLGLDIRRVVVEAVLRALGLPVSEVIRSLQNAEVILPRGSGRFKWPHQLLQEHLFRQLTQRTDRRRFFYAAADALLAHPLSNTRRVVRQRVINLLWARETAASEKAAEIFFNFLEQSWNGAKQPLATLADLDLFKGQLQGAPNAQAMRWRAEALRHVGRTAEATHLAESALISLQASASAQTESYKLQIEVARCQRLLGHLKCEQGSSDAGRRLVKRALHTFEQSKETHGIAQCALVLGQIEMLLGNYEQAAAFADRGEQCFSELRQPMGHGQCLLLSGAVAHSEGLSTTARRLTSQAHEEFERCGYRLGQAQSTASLAHVEHRIGNFFNSEEGAKRALELYESLKISRGQSSCGRLLAMLALDTDRLQEAGTYAEAAEKAYADMRDPWGIVEARLLRAQVALASRDLTEARNSLMRAREISVKEPEPRQHYLLTRAWYQHESDNPEAAQEALANAPLVFAKPWQVGDHTPQLLSRLSRLSWQTEGTAQDINEWRELIRARAREDEERVAKKRSPSEPPPATS